MDQRDSAGSLDHRRRDALHAAGPDVTDGEDAGKTCFEHKRGASQGLAKLPPCLVGMEPAVARTTSGEFCGAGTTYGRFRRST
jgi:hypothetical protein